MSRKSNSGSVLERLSLPTGTATVSDDHFRPLLLSLFPGVDLWGHAFELEWPNACIVRGPDCITGGDIRTFQEEPGVQVRHQEEPDEPDDFEDFGEHTPTDLF